MTLTYQKPSLPFDAVALAPPGIGETKGFYLTREDVNRSFPLQMPTDERPRAAQTTPLQRELRRRGIYPTRRRRRKGHYQRRNHASAGHPRPPTRIANPKSPYRRIG